MTSAVDGVDGMTAFRLARALNAAKHDEDRAKRVRIEAEEALIAALRFECQGEGSETYKLIGTSGTATVTLKQPVNRSVDGEVWLTIRKSLASTLADGLMRTKFELNLKPARELQDSDPATWAKVAECVTAKPGKVGVEIKSIEVEP